MMENRRLIEETFPVREVSEESAKEKSIRHGHISTLHIWWARRPLGSSRATNYAVLVPFSKDAGEIQKKRQSAIKLAKWENSLDDALIESTRREIQRTIGYTPKILDPFSGGGAIPLEASRLGCDTYANDYNPVATLILKCTLEFTQSFGPKKKKIHGLVSSSGGNDFLDDIKKWSAWVLEETRKEIGKFYPETNGMTPVGYVWVRTIPCQNPRCGAEIPLFKQYYLSNKPGRTIALFPYVSNKSVRFKLVGAGQEEKLPKDFNPNEGTVSRAIAKCLVCGSMVDNKDTPKLFREGKSNHRMIAKILHEQGTNGKYYELVKEGDIRNFTDSDKYLEKKRDELRRDWGVDPVPDEPTPDGRGKGAERAFSLRNYGMNTWGDLFNQRQKLALITLTDKIRKSRQEMIEAGYDENYVKAVITYLGLMLDRQADYNSSLCRWVSAGEFIGNTFARAALPMIWDYVELCPWSNSTGDWNSATGWIIRVIDHLSQSNCAPAHITQGSATSLPYPDSFFDAVLTDPPYYDNVPYSYLSDFFYVWLKRSLGEIYPDLFSTPLTPKSQEIVAYSNLEGGWEAGKQFFEDMLKKSFREITRVLKPNGIAVIVYAHKSTAGWETLINSLLSSGLVVTAAWPIHTEMKARLRGKESAALASSIYMVCRKMPRTPIGFYKEVRQELRNHINRKLEKLWNEGISGGDFFISAIGSSIEIFGRYEKIIDDEERPIAIDRLLEEVRKIVTDYAVKQVLHNGFAAEVSQLTRLYILWRWAYSEASILFDDARKLAQSVGVDLTKEWDRGFVLKNKEFITIMGPEDRKLEELKNSKELIDVLHAALLLWKKGKNADIVTLLKESGLGQSDVFYRVAQAISESLTTESKEKKLLEGFLAGKERISKDVRRGSGQRRLFDE
jgi:adenine-specific DNA methylase